MTEPGRAHVPKFSSFKSKASATSSSKDRQRDSSARPDSSTKNGERGYSSHKHKRRRLDDDRHENSHGRREDNDIEPRALKRRSSPGLTRVTHSPKPADSDQESSVFFIDRRGDAKNVEFGSIHRYDVPAYHRSGFGMLIGASRDIRIDREQSTSTQAVLQTKQRPNERPDRWLASKKSRIAARELRVVPRSAEAATWDLESEEIMLRDGPVEQDSIPIEEGGNDAVDYRSIEGKARPNAAPADDDLESISETEGVRADPAAALARQENVRLSQRVKETPSDLQSWIALAEHQSQVLNSATDLQHLTILERRALADVRVAVYQRAIKHFQNLTKERETLFLRLMGEAQYVWDTTKMKNKWEGAASASPGSMPIWTEYLNLVQTNPNGFSFEKCKAEFLRCFPAVVAGHADELDRIYLVLRFSALVRGAGYTELALSIWQILLERRFFKPEDDSLESLEAFWDADVPRIGEEGALGWAHFHKYGSRASRTATSGDHTQPDIKDLTDFAREERRLQHADFLSATTAEDADDPFRFVMFSDIRPVIDVVPDSVPGDLLVNAFLTFLGSPLLPTSHSGCSAWQADPFLRSTTTSTVEQRAPHTAENGLTCLLQCRPTSLQWLFDNAFDTVPVNKPDSQFVDRVLDMLCAAQPGIRDLAQYSTAYKLHFLPKNVAKVKKLLKAQPNDLALYNAYALAEAALGNMTKARQVWTLVPDGAVNDEDKLLLHRSWILTEASQGQDDEALEAIRSLCSLKRAEAAGGIAETAVERLKITQVLQRGWATMFEQAQYEQAVQYAECHAWYDYLGGGRDLAQTVAMFREWSQALSLRDASREMELLHEGKARLIRHHLTQRNRSHQPGAVQAELIESIRLFPDNTFFLQTYADNEIKFDLVDRIRAPLRKQLLGNASANLVGLSFSVEQEMQRYSSGIGGSTKNAVRNAFSRALLTPGSPARHCYSLWSSWLRFELASESRTSDDAQQRGKQVFFDGLRHLPWSKDWILLGLGFKWSDTVMSGSELAHVRKTLDERELRVRAEPL